MPAGSILVADDDTAIRTVLNQALSRAGYEVRLTGNAATLWRWVSQGEGDLVITDVVMPDENAFDLLPRIKKMRPNLPVIVMSAQNTFMTAIRASERGAYEYLPKPLPEYPAYEDLADDQRYKQITMRMLLDHTSGFPNWRRFTDDKKLRINFSPGSRFAYSGEGICSRADGCGDATGKSVNELMNDRVFQPLGMTRTSMVTEERFEDDQAIGYDEQGKSLGLERREKSNAAGSMQTTLRDYARFVQGVLSGAIPDRKSRNQMLSP